jgi:hypothetical protein
MCDRCLAKCLYHQSRFRAKNPISKLNQPAAIFKEHNDGCETCSYELRGTPRKTPSKQERPLSQRSESKKRKKSDIDEKSIQPKKGRRGLFPEKKEKERTGSEQRVEGSGVIIIDEIVISSISTDFFIEQELANVLKCNKIDKNPRVQISHNVNVAVL